ncbi:MAG TPA: MFS transporter [Methylomirabilota bacterium]|nr:MFS transporter [Methylomirabilota bacterium]
MSRAYGWVIVAVGIVVTCVGFGAMASLTVFLQPMAATMGWSRTGISTAALVNWLCMGLGAFLWGLLCDRFGTRLVVLAGGVLLGLGLVLASRVSTLLQFQLVFGVLVGLAAGSFYTPITAATARWFTRHRSLAVALVSAGVSMGSAVMGPVVRWLINSHDWRFAMLVIGDVVWLVIIPVAFLITEPPAAPAAAAGRAGAGEAGELTVAQALRTPQFAAVALAYFACCAAHSGPIFHMVSNAIDHGLTAMTAATVLSAASLASLGGKVVCGLVADRVGAKRTLVVGLVLQALAAGSYALTREPAGFYAVALVFGFAYGGVMPLYAIIVREYFGARIMGAVFGAVALVSTLGMALGPWAGGVIYDGLGGYGWLFMGSVAIGLGAAAVASTFRAPAVRVAVLASPTPAG